MLADTFSITMLVVPAVFDETTVAVLIVTSVVGFTVELVVRSLIVEVELGTVVVEDSILFSVVGVGVEGVIIQIQLRNAKHSTSDEATQLNPITLFANKKIATIISITTKWHRLRFKGSFC